MSTGDRSAERERRRQRALEMLKAKPRPTQEKPRGLAARKAQLDERERELEERARQLQEVETRLANGGGEPTAAVVKVEDATPPVSVPVAAQSSERPRVATQRKAAPSTDALLEVRDVDVHYGQIQGLRSLNITINPGEVVALLGVNGAGKSSTLRAISGMVAPSAGEIIFDGEPIGGLPAHEVVKRGIAHVPEGRELFPTMTVEENLRLGYWPRRRVRGGLKAALDHVYEMFPRMAERRNQAAGTMSGGEQQMLVFGRALMSSPRLLLVDEMSLGLAPLIVRTLFEAVKVIHREGASVIIVEQFVHLALRNSQRAYVLARGQVSLEAESAKLASDPNLVAAYLGGAEGNVEEAAAKAKGKGARKRPAKSKT